MTAQTNFDGSPQRSTRHDASARRARTIVIGASHWHVPLYASAITEVHGFLGCSDTDPTRIPAALTAAADITTARWQDLLGLPDVELAYVFSPHNEMAAVCLALIDRGVAVVVEKPLGTSLEQLQAVRKAAENAGVPVTAPLVQRGGPVDEWLAQAGRPVYQRSSFIAGPPDRYTENGSPWMLDPFRAGGGCLANLGPHFVDLFLHRAASSTTQVEATVSSTLHGRAVEDHATLVLTTDDGREAVVEVGYAFPGSVLKRYCSYTSAGDRGFAAIDSTGSATFTATDGHTVTTTLDVDSDPLYAPFVHQVARTLDNGFRGLPTLGELEDTMRIIWGAYRTEQRAAHP